MKDEILSAMQNQLAALTTLVSHKAQNGLPMGQGIFNYSSSLHKGSFFYGNPNYIQGALQDFFIPNEVQAQCF